MSNILTKELIIGTWVNAEGEPSSWNSFSPKGEWIYQSMKGSIRKGNYAVKNNRVFLTAEDLVTPVSDFDLEYDENNGFLRFFNGEYIARRGDDEAFPAIIGAKIGTITINGKIRVFYET